MVVKTSSEALVSTPIILLAIVQEELLACIDITLCNEVDIHTALFRLHVDIEPNRQSAARCRNTILVMHGC